MPNAALHSSQLAPSPDGSGRLRYAHAVAEHQFSAPLDVVFDVFSGWVAYERWAPEVQGPAHWLLLRHDAIGSKFILYDKPGPRHLIHYGEVTAYDAPYRFAWGAPFAEWPHLRFGTEVECAPTHGGGCRLRETVYFEADDSHLPVLEGFINVAGYEADTFATFLATRLRGLDQALRNGVIDTDRGSLFTANRVVAADWPGRTAGGEWVRILHASGEVEFDAQLPAVFNTFSGFAHYADWTRMIHVGQQWLHIAAGGVGSRFVLWEKPGDRHVLHHGVVTQFERNRLFTWRAPFSEWDKVFIGTSIELSPLADGRTRAYHILYADLPTEYLPVFAGFSSLHGFDLEFETFHIYEEGRGLNALLAADAIPPAERRYLFDEDMPIAVEHPMTVSSHCAQESLTFQPDRILTYEDALLESVQAVTGMLPTPGFLRQHRVLPHLRERAAMLGRSHAPVH